MLHSEAVDRAGCRANVWSVRPLKLSYGCPYMTRDSSINSVYRRVADHPSLSIRASRLLWLRPFEVPLLVSSL